MRILLTFVLFFSLWVTGCAILEPIFGGVDEAAAKEADTDHDGEISDEELNAFIAKVKARTTDNLPFPFNMIGGLAAGALGTVWSEYRNRKKKQALDVYYEATELTGKNSPVKQFIHGRGNPVIEKMVKKRKRKTDGK